MKTLAYLVLFTSFLTNLLVLPKAFGKTYIGYLEKTISTYFIITKNKNKLELKFQDQSLLSILKKLNTNDYLSIDALPNGSVGKSENSLNVLDINYVGLSLLLGFWKDQSGLCYNFSGFTQYKTVKLQQEICGKNAFLPGKTDLISENFNYFINPDNNVWNMLVSDNKHQYLAEINILNANKIRLILFNAIDGKSIPDIILQKQP